MKFFIFAIILAATNGYAMAQGDEKISLYKCGRAAMYLGQNEDLMKQAVSWKHEQLSQNAVTREEHMRYISRINKVMSEVMRGNGSLDNSKLLGWYNSGYCKNLLKDYQSYKVVADKEREAMILAKNKRIEDALLNQVNYYSKSLVNENSKEVSCNKFKEQVDMAFNNVSASKYKRDLLKGLLSTILDSSFKLKKYQVDFIKSKAESDFEYLAKETYAGCPNESLLSNQLKLIDSIKYSTSLKASWIGGKIAELQRDGECGELSQFYCLAELRREAAKKAYDVVKKCDDEENFDGQCAMDAEGLYISELKKIEILKLSEHREKHEQYIADPVRGVGERGFVYLVADRIVLDTMANDCRRLALKSGLKGEDYTKYEKDVCIPNAKTEYVKPQVLILQKIINRLNFIQK